MQVPMFEEISDYPHCEISWLYMEQATENCQFLTEAQGKIS